MKIPIRKKVSRKALSIIEMRDDRNMQWKHIASFEGNRIDWVQKIYRTAKKQLKENEQILGKELDAKAPKIVSNDQLIPYLDTILLNLLERWMKVDMSEISPRDLSTATAMFLEKKKLYAGEPTDITERRTIIELLPKIRAEIKRRGLDKPVIEAVKTEYSEET